MWKLISVTISLLCVLMAGCTQKLAHYDYNPGFSYAGYQSYSIQQSEKQTYQSLDGERIETAIRQQLAGRYNIAEPGQADFLINYYLEAEHKLEQSGVSFGFGMSSGPVGVGVNTSPPAKEKTEGKLVLEVVDVATKQLVWTAKATRNLKEGMHPTQRQYLIQDLVQEMLANFPPQ